jgi:hypothetical protein
MVDDKENKKYEVEYQIDIPVVIFSYKKKSADNKETVFVQKYAYNSMFEKFGIQKEDPDANNPNKIITALEKCFSTNKVTFEIFQKTKYAIHFRADDDTTIFKAFLEPTVQSNQAVLKSSPDKKINIQWEIAIPNVIFNYTDENGVVFEEKLDYNCMFEKFGMTQKEEDKKNELSLKGTITRYFYQDKVSLEPFQQDKYWAIEFKSEENDTTLFKVFLKPKMHLNIIPMKEKPDLKFNIEWVVDIPNVIFTYKEKKDGKEIVYSSQLNYDNTFEKFGLKKEEKDIKNPQRLTNEIKKYFDEGKVRVLEFQKIYYSIEFLEEGDKNLFQVFLKY